MDEPHTDILIGYDAVYIGKVKKNTGEFLQDLIALYVHDAEKILLGEWNEENKFTPIFEIDSNSSLFIEQVEYLMESINNNVFEFTTIGELLCSAVEEYNQNDLTQEEAIVTVLRDAHYDVESIATLLNTKPESVRRISLKDLDSEIEK